VITGASAGVGRATARKFASAGAKLGLIAREPNRLEELKKEVESAGGQALSVSMDAAIADDMFRAADEIERAFGAIDIWINNAMVTVVSEFKDMEPAEYRRITEVCYLSFVYGTMAALRKMLPRNRGTIVQVGSALAYRAIPLQSAYCGAKHAIKGFSESVRTELMHNHTNIHVTMVQMPALNTPQFSWCRTRMSMKPQPVPPIFQPEVAADAIFWSAHHPHRRELTVGGFNTIILWGNKFFPGLGDWYLAKTGYESQMTAEPVEKNRTDNLFKPVPGPFAARGDFNDRARETCWQLKAATRPGIFILSIILGGIFAFYVLSRFF
jgi:short-subunit dehydrogenase